MSKINQAFADAFSNVEVFTQLQNIVNGRRTHDEPAVEVEDPSIAILENVIDMLEDDPTEPGAVDYIINELDFVIRQIDDRNKACEDKHADDDLISWP